MRASDLLQIGIRSDEILLLILFFAFCSLSQVVVITGASSGIGEALAHEFYTAGCKVVLAARRVNELERVSHNLLNLHIDTVETHRPEVVPLDLADIKSLPAKAAHILAKCGHVDILINNGGISVRTDVLSAQTDVDVRVMNVNYLGTVALTKGMCTME